MKNCLIVFLFVLCAITSKANAADGQVVEVKGFKSQYIKPKDLYIWLPSDYDSNKTYAVLYMHDGQMLFDSLTTWNKQEWCVDEMMTKLSSVKRIIPTIVVGVSNTDGLRYAEYFPQRVFENISEPTRDLIQTEQFKSEPLADKYLKFLVYELKPYIDSVYSTKKDANNTFVMGSSMGGLISLYALCEYPQVFGGAACLSMHVPMVSFGLFDKVDIENDVASVFRAYLDKHLPATNSRKIYIDYGDRTLDAYYRPYQKKIDDLLKIRGWRYPHWQTRFYPGEDHSEKAWAKRLDTPLIFLLSKQTK